MTIKNILEDNQQTLSNATSGPYSHGDTSDTCPVCKKTMTPATASGVNVNFCQEHRITMPTPS